ncbi:hypothetical protein [Lactiplantibacillus plantarum]|uniref:hypothetical protein n=1 Tax=Lactiplantibacillus plantarum TaxID=1590 RepID=UPI002551E65A|nr:hypothetical protein [Lactiplantibacillus plantarum]WIR74283.1 hypothetical protein QP382_16400 [Lactiplantibacillus plantarum]
MEAAIIEGKNDSGKTGICNELIGVEKTIVNLRPGKYKNKICLVKINNKNCLIVSEGDNEACIENIKDYYEELINNYNKTVDFLIVTARTNTKKDLVAKAKSILRAIDSTIKIHEFQTSKSKNPNFSISKEIYKQGQKIQNVIK